MVGHLKARGFIISEGSVSHINGVWPSFLTITIDSQALYGVILCALKSEEKNICNAPKKHDYALERRQYDHGGSGSW